MTRTVLAVVTLVLGLSVAIAQGDPIKARKDLMKANGDAVKTAVAMIKDEKPFDLAEAHKIFATFEDAATKMPNLFPDSSKSEAGSGAADDFSAGPKVWENMTDFKARFAKFGDDAKAANASVTDLSSFKAAIGNIGKNDCGGCHETYRLKKS